MAGTVCAIGSGFRRRAALNRGADDRGVTHGAAQRRSRRRDSGGDTAVLALLPPVLVVLLMRRWFVTGLTEGEK